jgi:tRNA A-37 threonylcarbamoyl transferase component Bud32
MVQVGDKIGNYQVVRSLGSGAMGTVYEAQHEQIKSRVAVKVLHPHYAQHSGVRDRFFQEAYTANRVSHPGVVSVFDHGQVGDSAYIIMELLPGESLYARMRRGGKRLEQNTALRLLRQIAWICAAAHQKSIVHRDLKPENMMVIPDPFTFGGERVKILDFGIAKLLDHVRPAGYSQGLFGTPMYMAPEAWEGSQNIDQSADVYSLGVIAYELFAGRTPYDDAGDNIARWQQQHASVIPKDLSAVDASISSPISQLVGKMMAKERQQRPAMLDVARTLEQLVGANLRFRAGGFVRDGEFYLRRTADETLFSALSHGQDAVVIGSRLSGRTSLRIRMEHRLAALRDAEHPEGIRCCVLDLLAQSRTATPENFFFELLRESHRGLGLDGFPGDFWNTHAQLSPSDRWQRFLTELPTLVLGPAVLLVDHLDGVAELPQAIREQLLDSLTVQRSLPAATVPCHSVCVCLFGNPAVWSAPPAASAQQEVTPKTFPIASGSPIARKGKAMVRIELADFTQEQASGLLPGLHALGTASESVFRELYQLSAGHPYLLQRLCESVSAGPVPDGSLKTLVESAVSALAAAQARGEEPIFTGAERYLTGSDTSAIDARRLYASLLTTQSVPGRWGAEATARTQLDLVCAGVAVWREGQLSLRNDLFRRLLGASWLAEKDKVRPITEPLRAFRERTGDERYLLSGVVLATVLSWSEGRADLTAEEQQFLGQSLQRERKGQRRQIAYLSLGLLLVVGMLVLTALSLRNAQRAEQAVRSKQAELILAVADAQRAQNEAVAARNQIDAARKKTQLALHAADEAIAAQSAALQAQGKAQSVAAAQRGIAAQARLNAQEALQRATLASQEAQSANQKADTTQKQALLTVQSAAQSEQRLRQQLEQSEHQRTSLEQRLSQVQQQNADLQQKLAAVIAAASEAATAARPSPPKEVGSKDPVVKEPAEATPKESTGKESPAPPPVKEAAPAEAADSARTGGAVPIAKEPEKKEPAKSEPEKKEPEKKEPVAGTAG